MNACLTSVLIGVALAAALGSTPALAQSAAQLRQWQDWCAGRAGATPEQTEKACVALLQSGHAMTVPAAPAMRRPKTKSVASAASASVAIARADMPRPLGRFGDWTAATHLEGGQTVCYAFTRAQASVPRLPGRGDVVMTVAERVGQRDAVAISAGYVYPPLAEPRLHVGDAEFNFYTAQSAGFSRDGHAVVTALLGGRAAVMSGPGPNGFSVTDNFSLHGFQGAYAALGRVCG